MLAPARRRAALVVAFTAIFLSVPISQAHALPLFGFKASHLGAPRRDPVDAEEHELQRNGRRAREQEPDREPRARDLDVGDRVFEPYVSTKETGLGLGLAICRRIVEAHGGQIAAANTPPRGAVFTVRLPTGKTTNEPVQEPCKPS